MTTPARPDEAVPTRGLVESLPAIVWEADPATSSMTYVSPRSQDLLGYTPEEWLASPTFWEDHLHPDDRAAAVAAAERVIADAGTTQVNYRFRAANGDYAWFQDAFSISRREDGSVRLGGVMLALAEAPATPARSERELGEVAARSLDAAAVPLHQSIVDNLGDGVYYVDRDRRITYWNHGAERLTGYEAKAVVGRQCQDNLLCHVDAAGTNLCANGCPLNATIRDGRSREVLAWLRHQDGSRRPVNVRTSPLREGNGGDGPIVGAVEIFSDATGLVEAHSVAERAMRDAMTDPVTGVPTRRLLDAVLAARQDDLNRHALPFGLLLVDIDDLATFTKFGSAVGNQVLAVTAQTLKGGLRGGDTLVRWGAGQFAIAGAQVDGPALARLAERQLHLVRNAHVAVPGGRLPIRVSIGGSLARPRQPLDALIKRATDALLLARAGGGDRFLLNDPVQVSRQPRLLGVRVADRDEVGSPR